MTVENETEVAIRAIGLSKKFRLRSERRESLKERFVRGKGAEGKEFWALRDVTFDVLPGEMFGIIGHNGSGKSTALKVVAGIYRPTGGSVQIRGRLSALIELGAGFHPDLTGRENIRLNGSILGMSEKEIEAATEEIIDFAGIGRFIDSPVKVYSSGMYVRLGFAIAVNVDPDILAIDEVMAVGDEDFQRKCFRYIHKLRARGSTILIVTHGMRIVEDNCDRAIWLDRGKMAGYGQAREVVGAYLDQVNRNESDAASKTPTKPSEQNPAAGEGQATADAGEQERRGSGEVVVTRVETLDSHGTVVPFLTAERSGTIRIHYRCRHAVERVVFGLDFDDDNNIRVAGPNSGRQGPQVVLPGEGHVDFEMTPVILRPTTYRLSTNVWNEGALLDAVSRGFEIDVTSSGGQEPGAVYLPGHWNAAAEGR
jgi:ABC-2 type transport system ATP-binding protein/lipopolysaccharide transport system ATP-binding protein